MTESERLVAETPEPQEGPGKALVPHESQRADGDTASAQHSGRAEWLRKHQVMLGGLLLIAADLVWRAQTLSKLYFRQDDFRDLILADKSPLSWHYLSFIGAGHFMMGQRILFRLLAGVSLYDWALASAIMLFLLACAALAALRVLRTLFGEHPAILFALALFLTSPLTVPSFGWWSSATEELPTVLAIFMAVNAHVWYLRRGQTRHLVASAGWVAFGLFFYEKGLVLPLLLFAVTALYFTGGRSLRAAAWLALVRYRMAWLCYAGLLVIYSVLLAVSLPSTIAPPQTPHSLSAVLTFCWDLLKNNLIPGTVGGPWRWLPISGGTYSIAAPPAGLTWLALIVVAGLVGASIVRRKVAWRAWTLWIGWVVIADMLPVVIRRINGWSPALYALDTRFVVDSVAVFIIAICLAFLPLVPEQRSAVPAFRLAAKRSESELAWRRFGTGLLVIVAIGTIVSTRSYYAHTSGTLVARYIANAKQALHLAPKGVLTVDGPVPSNVFVGPVRPALASSVIGGMAPGRLRWTTAPSGTIDGLRIFGPDGRLYIARVQGGESPSGKPCFPNHHGKIVVNFWTASPGYTTVMRIGYLWYSKTPGVAEVRYGTSTQAISLQPGLHAGYLKVTGSEHGIVVDNISGGGGLCIGDAAAGFLVPNYRAPALPVSAGTGAQPAAQGREEAAPSSRTPRRT